MSVYDRGRFTTLPLMPTSPYTLTRRAFVGAGGALAGLAALQGVPGLSRLADAAPLSSDLFSLGVASGDPGTHSVVLWTRLAPDPLNGGGMPPAPVHVRWEIANDPEMRQVVRRGTTRAFPRFGHNVHAQATGLPSDRWFWYRFDANGEASRIGRTRTFPRAHATPDRMRFALASCQNYEQGHYAAYLNMAEEDLDFVVHVGDYIYEGGASPGALRQHNGPEIQTLEDYRNRYALYRLDPSLQAAHAAFPFLLTWDDHEVDNNYAGDFPQDEQSTEAFLARRAAAFQAYFEHMPLRHAQRPRDDRMRIYRRLRFGRLAQIHMLDTRQFRTDQCSGPGGELCPEAFDPASQMLGSKQESWLFRNLARSPATWNVLGQGVMMMQWDIAGGMGGTKFVNFDQWDGYPLPRARLLDFLAERRPANPIVLAGDIHSSWVGDLKADFDDASSPIVGSEFVGTSISSNASDVLITLAELSLPGNPHIQFFNGRRRGYVRIEADSGLWRADYRGVDDVTDPLSSVATLASFVVEDGVPGVGSA